MRRPRYLNDESGDAPKLRVFLNVYNLAGLSGSSIWKNARKDKLLETLEADGFEGVQLTEDGPPPVGPLPHCGLGRINQPQEALPLAEKHKARGDLCLTVHAGWGIEDDDDVFRLVEAILAASDKTRLPILLDWRQSWWPPWQYRLMESAGVEANWNRPLYLAEWVYDPIIRDSQQHPYGGFGANDAIMLGLGAGDNRDCLVVFRNDRGTPLTAIGSLSKKVVVVSATDSQGSQFKSSWYFHGSDWVNAGSAYSGPKPDPRHGGKTLCLFADGHTELIDTDRMSAADRRKYFLLPQFE